MDIEPIRQLNLGDIPPRRFGDVLSNLLGDSEYSEFHFAVAYMRTSGLGRLLDDIQEFQERGGHVAGAVGVGGRLHGVDQGVTSVEALNSLLEIAPDSTVFSTVSDLIFHPKIYLFKGDSTAVAVVGSANVTQDGLYRNVEVGSILYFDLTLSHDRDVFEQYESFVTTLLDHSTPNVQSLDEDIISTLEENDIIPSESDRGQYDSGAPGDSDESGTQTTLPDETDGLFPPLEVETPPSMSTESSPGSSIISATGDSEPAEASVFVMQLSASDCSHRTGTAGTPMILIPKAAVPFFPELTEEGDTDPPDAYSEVRQNTPNGPIEYEYRFWYYEGKEEYRFRVKSETIDLTTEGGGDIMVVEKLEDAEIPEFEVTFVKPDDPEFDELLAACDRSGGDKRWGLLEEISVDKNV